MNILSIAFPDHAGIASLHRNVYKYVDCGPAVWPQIEYTDATDIEGHEDTITRWIYSQAELSLLGDWDTDHADGSIIVALSVSSIVEGIDECTDTITVEVYETDQDGNRIARPPADIAAEFWAAVTSVDDQANALWNQTHGCDSCAEHLGLNEYGEGSPIWPDCPDCNGQGLIL